MYSKKSLDGCMYFVACILEKQQVSKNRHRKNYSHLAVRNEARAPVQRLYVPGGGISGYDSVSEGCRCSVMSQDRERRVLICKWLQKKKKKRHVHTSAEREPETC